ncbi:MAG TPA: hypothetical protein DCS29_00040 [Candidatus Magasanikbacteria bacterium]|nr:hypothetical protein [Candidatus Magasanikbacteria bacterium]
MFNLGEWILRRYGSEQQVRVRIQWGGGAVEYFLATATSVHAIGRNMPEEMRDQVSFTLVPAA